MNRVRLSMLVWLVATAAFGHEGHQPLPTRGVQLDLKSGKISLSRSARELIDVRTAAAERREHRTAASLCDDRRSVDEVCGRHVAAAGARRRVARSAG